MIQYVLVSQGVEIYRTFDKDKAYTMKESSEDDYWNEMERVDGTEYIPDTRIEIFWGECLIKHSLINNIRLNKSYRHFSVIIIE